MTPGIKINLKSGHEATVTRVGTGDFIGDSYPIYYQYIDGSEVKTGFLMSDELRVSEIEPAGGE